MPMDDILRDNCYLASASGDDTVRLWNTQNISLYSIETVAITCIKALDKNTLAIANTSGIIQVWNLLNTTQIRSFQAHDSVINSLALLENGSLASASDDKKIKIWLNSSNVLVVSLEGHSSGVRCLCVLDCNTIISGSCGEDSEIKIWSLESGNEGRCIRTLSGIFGSVTGLVKLDEKQFLSSDADGIIIVWNVDDDRIIRLADTGSSVQCIKMLPNNFVASGHADRTIKIWQVDTMEELLELEGHDNSVACLELLSENLLVSGSTDGRIKIWRLDAATCVETLERHKGLIVGLQLLNPDIVSDVDNYLLQ